ncbi:MAG: thrombospondin type 3 repeat-containing protein [Prevotellaceae bacterium]|jgi:hypothetical protein|nr:thrombospondin type 3 repeat-containing protein [Prevotellaceae bacterium]
MMKYIQFIFVFATVLLMLPENELLARDKIDRDDTYAILKKKREKMELLEKLELKKNQDSDGDGIIDEEDECPSIPGTRALRGCPDSDEDGIPDHLDDCPYTPGPPQFRGCPDRDNDGVPDHKDVCPDVAGTALNNGCPDSDKAVDSINFDYERDMQLQRYEKYIYEQELFKQEYRKRQEYLWGLENADNSRNVPSRKNSKPKQDKNHNRRTIAEQENSYSSSPSGSQETPSWQLPMTQYVPPEAAPRQVAATAQVPATVSQLPKYGDNNDIIVINNSKQFDYRIPELELILNDVKFLRGRVFFTDERKSFEALTKLAALCMEYSEWEKITINCYSNNEINNVSISAYRLNQLFQNRVDAIKTILIRQLNVPAQRLTFKSCSEPASNQSNYIKLQIDVR